MPVLITAVALFLIFLVVGVLGFRATFAGHGGHTCSAGGGRMDLRKPGRGKA
jgi:hypothetical protein